MKPSKMIPFISFLLAVSLVSATFMYVFWLLGLLQWKTPPEPTTQVTCSVISEWVSDDGTFTRRSLIELPNGDDLTVVHPIGAPGNKITLWHRAKENKYYWNDPDGGAK